MAQIKRFTCAIGTLMPNQVCLPIPIHSDIEPHISFNITMKLDEIAKFLPPSMPESFCPFAFSFGGRGDHVSTMTSCMNNEAHNMSRDCLSGNRL